MMLIYPIAALTLSFSLVTQQAKPPAKPFEPYSGQPGKDVVWVPTPPELVEKMLDMARVTPQDLVMDLGSGDGRNIIGAAKRGARAIGVEYNPDMVELSRRLAKEAGVADKATFVEGDMYVADISKASVMALFLLTSSITIRRIGCGVLSNAVICCALPLSKTSKFSRVRSVTSRPALSVTVV